MTFLTPVTGRITVTPAHTKAIIKILSPEMLLKFLLLLKTGRAYNKVKAPKMALQTIILKLRKKRVTMSPAKQMRVKTWINFNLFVRLRWCNPVTSAYFTKLYPVTLPKKIISKRSFLISTSNSSIVIRLRETTAKATCILLLI